MLMTVVPASVASPAIMQRARGFWDLHFSQKWRIVWPQLASLPLHGLSVLDAGCGEGRWSLEIAARRSRWSVIGIDRDASAIERAQLRQGTFGLGNVAFHPNDFVDFIPRYPFDVVLSICSAHYLGHAATEVLFQRMSSWLKPDGLLVLLAPRCDGEQPFVSQLAHPPSHDVFSQAALTALCERSELIIDQLVGRIGRIGTVAKQLDWSRASIGAPTGVMVWVLARGLASVDAYWPVSQNCSLMWLLVARRRF